MLLINLTNINKFFSEKISGTLGLKHRAPGSGINLLYPAYYSFDHLDNKEISELGIWTQVLLITQKAEASEPPSQDHLIA